MIKKVTSIKEIDLNYSHSFLFLSTVILAPFIEELFFRLVLKPKYLNWLILSIFSGILTAIFIYKKIFLLLIPFSILTIIEFIFLLNRKSFRRMQIFFLNHFCFFFYLSSLLFGLLHVTNYEPFNYKLIILMPILVSPIVVVGIILGFIRMKFGIWYSMLMHSMINLIAFLVFLVGK